MGEKSSRKHAGVGVRATAGGMEATLDIPVSADPGGDGN